LQIGQRLPWRPISRPESSVCTSSMIVANFFLDGRGKPSDAEDFFNDFFWLRGTWTFFFCMPLFFIF
jgi:hypothetical protein